MSLPVVFVEGSTAVVDPESGEMYPLADAPAPLLALVVDYLDNLAREARSARAAVADELMGRMGGARHLDLGAFGVEQSQRREWDPDATWQALSGLLEAGHVTAQEVDEAMPERTERKPDGRKLTAILTRLVGDDPVAAQPLARARSQRSFVKVQRTAVDATATEVAA